MRWKADDYRIGQSELSGVETTGWRTEIREKDTPNRLWAGGHSITVYVGKPVTAEVWNEVSAALNAGESPPIFYDLLYDAMAHLERGDLQRMVVDAAVVTETYMKIIVQEGLPDGLNDQLKKYINEANVRRLIDRLFPECLDTQQEKTYMNLKPDLHKLFDDRNDIMHKGEKEGLTAEHCQRLVNSVRALLALVPYGVH